MSKTRWYQKAVYLLLALALVLLLGVLPQSEALAQPTQYWAKTYGGSLWDVAWSIQQTSDGGYIVAGQTTSFGAGNDDFWVLKLDENGDVSWQKTYGGSEGEIARSVQQTSDGGYIVAGSTASFGTGSADLWVLKLDANGGATWQKTYGGIGVDAARSIQQTSDGGYIVAGYTNSFGAPAGPFDFWVLKLDENGGVTWQKTYGGSTGDSAYSIQQTSDDKGYIVAGYTTSFGAGNFDFWVLKLDANGGVTWQKTYGGSSWDEPRSIQQTSYGGYIVAGVTASFEPDNKFWVLKLDENGGVSWQKTYGGSEGESAYSVQQTSDGGYIVAGYTSSFGAGSADFWVLKLDENGDVSWQKAYGGDGYDEAHSIQQTSDGGYIVAGVQPFGVGNVDFWVLKLDENGTIPACPLGVASGATVTGTSVEGQDTVARVDDTHVPPVDTSITPPDTDCSIDTQCFYTPPPPPPPVGGEAYPVSKASLMAPWIAVGLILAGGISWYVLRRRRARS